MRQSHPDAPRDGATNKPRAAARNQRTDNLLLARPQAGTFLETTMKNEESEQTPLEILGFALCIGTGLGIVAAILVVSVLGMAHGVAF